MTVNILLRGHFKDRERDGFTALLNEKFRPTKTFDGLQTTDLTDNLEDSNNRVITERWNAKENCGKYLQRRQAVGTLDRATDVCRDAPTVSIFSIADASSC